MNDLKSIIAKNLTELRKLHNMTQLELAEKLNYSDKAISKWERGESLPDIEILHALAEQYGVTLDYLTKETHEKTDVPIKSAKIQNNKVIIALLAISAILFLATAMYVYAKVLFKVNYWLVFIWAIPICSIVSLVFNLLWGKRIFTFYIVSVFIWSIITAFYLEYISYNFWPIFFVGIPAQISIILWSKLK